MIRMLQTKWIGVGFVLLFLVCPLQQLAAQDELQEARKWPSEMLNNSETVLKLIDWQITQKRAIARQYELSKLRIQESVERLKNEEKHYLDQNPSPFVSLNDAGRSDLAGEVMKQQMQLNLQIAALQEMIKSEEKSPELKVNKANDEILEAENTVAIKSANSRLEVAAAKLKQTEKMYDNGFVSAEQVLQARSDFEIAQMELDIKQSRLELLKNSDEANQAKRMTELRVELEPLKAQLAYLEQLKVQIDDATKIAKQQQVFDRNRSLLHLDLEMVAKELSQVNYEMIELETLHQLIRDRQTHVESKKETQAKESESKAETK